MLRPAVHNEKSAGRLSQIKTNWTQLFAATRASSEVATEAQRELLINYSGAVYAYLMGAVKNEETASDLAQEFAVRFLRGDFRSVAPEKGRFRDFLKRTLSNLVNDHFRKQKAEQNRIQSVAQDAADVVGSEVTDSFEENWVIEVLRRTWIALEDEHSNNNTHYFTVLRARAESPELNSRELCELLSKSIPDQSWNEAWVRQNLSRARKQFAILLRAEVARTLKENRSDLIDEELAALGLLKYCQ